MTGKVMRKISSGREIYNHMKELWVIFPTPFKMGDAGVTQIPKANQPHLTTVTIKNDPTIQPAGPVVVLNVNYISSWHGLLKGLQLEFYYVLFATLFYITGMITQLVVWSKADAQKYFASSNLAAGSFGFFNTLAYGAETLLIFLEL
ncbi:uncharacterized protein LOC136028402 isoform X2 [Artemia franciscana]|uniref:uncharacterized protein LOC136028402 isoform X2 n=1 Tax=Artemia franciscana TaxID=6661 RepID=UPI0032DAD041